MRTVLTCGWCSHPNELDPCGPTFCGNCSHRADCSRLFCDCAKCRDGWRPDLTASDVSEAMDRLAAGRKEPGR